MNASIPTEIDERRDEPRLDLTGLLGSAQVFAAGDDPRLQAEMVDANCNKMGAEGCCCS